MSFKNVSKFRFCKVKESPKEQYGADLRLADPTAASPLAASARWLAFNYGSLNAIARIALVPCAHEQLSAAVRFDNELPTIQAHADQLGDMAFAPFAPSASGTRSGQMGRQAVHDSHQSQRKKFQS